MHHVSGQMSWTVSTSLSLETQDWDSVDKTKTKTTRRVAIIRRATATQSRPPSPCGLRLPLVAPKFGTIF